MAFNEFRPLDDTLELTDSRIVALKMTHLKDSFSSLGDFNQLSPFLDIHGQRFLDQYVYSLFEKVAGNFMVQTRWHGDAYRLNPAKQLAIVVDGFRVEFLSKLKSFGFIAVNNGN